MYSFIILSAIPAIYAAPLAFRRDACSTGHVQCNASSSTVAVCIEGSHRTLGPITGLDCSQVPTSLIGAVTSDKTSLRRRQDIGCENGFHCDSDMNEFALCMNDVVVARIDVAGGICPFIFPKSTPLEPSTSSSAPAPPGPTPTPAPAPPAAPIKKRQEESEAVPAQEEPVDGAVPDQANPDDASDPGVSSDEAGETNPEGNDAGGESGGENGGENGGESGGENAGDDQQNGASDNTADDLVQPPAAECTDSTGCSEVNADVPVVDQGGIVPIGAAEVTPVEDTVAPGMDPEKRQEQDDATAPQAQDSENGGLATPGQSPEGTQTADSNQDQQGSNPDPAVMDDSNVPDAPSGEGWTGCGDNCPEDGGAGEP